MRINFPNRLELLFRAVWAFPNASRIGLAWRICRSNRPSLPLIVGVADIEEEDLCLYDVVLGSPDSGALDPLELDGVMFESVRE